MSILEKLQEALRTNASALLAYEDLTIAELVDTGELSMFYRLREDKVLLLKAMDQFGDFMARRACQLEADKAQLAANWLKKLKCALA